VSSITLFREPANINLTGDACRWRGGGRPLQLQVPEQVLAEEGRAVHGALHDVLRQVRRLRAVGALREQGRVPLLPGHDLAQERAPQVPLGGEAF
jgi:hypothetical protein